MFEKQKLLEIPPLVLLKADDCAVGKTCPVDSTVKGQTFNHMVWCFE